MFKPLPLFTLCLLSLPLFSQPCSDGSDPDAVTVSLAGEQTFDEIGDFDNTILTAVFSGPRRIVGIIADDITVSPIGGSYCIEAVIGIGGAVDYRPSLQDNVGPCADNPSSGSFNLSDLALDFESATGIVNLELFESFDDNFNAADATFTTGSITLLGCPVGETLLPVELISFRAAALEKKVRLEWVTATEQDNAGFTVQRSTDGTSWRPIGWVDGNGAATAEQRYDFLDEQVAPATTYYYRLEQRDFDGATELSEVREVTTGAVRRQHRRGGVSQPYGRSGPVACPACGRRREHRIVRPEC